MPLLYGVCIFDGIITPVHILVTGGAGFIGSHTVDALLDAGHAVRVFDNFTTGFRRHAGVEHIEGDIRDLEALQHAVDDIDAIAHLAALVSVPQSLAVPLETVAINTSGVANVLEAARCSPKQPRVLLASTASIYGDLPGRKFEDSPIRPLVPYATSKLMSEQLCAVYTRSYGLETQCLRYFNVYGPRQRADSPYSGVLTKWTHAIQTGQPCLVFGDGENTRDFVHVTDVARANLLALTRPLPADAPVLNVASGVSVSLNQMLASMARALGRPLDIRYQPPRAGDILHSSADSTRLQQAFHWAATVPLDAGLAELLSF
jgi:UDP-glucose 4-epimerase